MKRMTKASLLAMLVVVSAFAGGCVSNPADAERSDDPEVWGYVASADGAQLEIAPTQQGASEILVGRVLAPGDAWVVVHLDDNGKPGMRVGLQRVEKGESKNVSVKLEEVGTEKVIVALHADRGIRDEFDFDMMAPAMSPDRPYFVDGKELAQVVTVREFGVKTPKGTAAISASPQAGAREKLIVDRVIAPADAWVVVHLDDEGAPGERVGLTRVAAGESTDVAVGLYPLPLTDKLFVAVHADAGEKNLFEFDMMNRVNSPDQPYFVDGAEVATEVRVR